MNNFKPLLAASVEDVTKLQYPLHASPKLDGIRAIVIDGVLLSRNLKPIPNKHLQKIFGKKMYNGLDGELIMGDPTSSTAFRDTSSAVMSIEGTPAVKFYVFDDFNEPDYFFIDRQAILTKRSLNAEHFVCWVTTRVSDAGSLMELDAEWVRAGYEGSMLRSASGRYKMGRSTLKEGILLKLKQFADSEAEIIGFEEQMHNGNEATKDNLGRTKRSTHKANKSGTGKLGAFIVRDLKTGVEFNVGTGFEDILRESLWIRKEEHLGQIVKYRYFPTGSKDKPRFPTFLGFRDPIDF